MERMIDIIGLLQIIIRLGVACRVVICLLKMNFNNDDGGVAENKMRIKNSLIFLVDRKSTRLNSSHNNQSRMPSSA